MREKLTLTQRETLMALITLYRKKGESVRGEDIAAFIKRNPGTIRNQMQIMKSLGLADGVPGPKGGYKPTMNAYKVINTDSLEEEAMIIDAKLGEEDIQDNIKDALIALITLYREKGESVRGEDIAAFIKRNPGTIRNQMQTMKSLDLVEGVPGPKGGYKPTINAYKAVNIDLSDEETMIMSEKLGEKGINVELEEEDLPDEILLSKIKNILSEIDFFLEDKIVREITVTEILLWIWLCYQFELYEKGAKLFRRANPEHSEIYKEIEMIGRICEGRVK